MNTSVLEMPAFIKQPIITTFPNQNPNLDVSETEDGSFSDDEIQSMNQDDAMASGMIAVILACAFLVLLALTVGVTTWMMTAAT